MPISSQEYEVVLITCQRDILLIIKREKNVLIPPRSGLLGKLWLHQATET